MFIAFHWFSALKWWAFLDRHNFMSLVSFYSQSIFLSDRSAAFGCLSFGCALSIGRRMDIFVCCLPGFQKARSTSTVRPARWSWRPAIEILTVVKYDRLKHITLQGKRNLTNPTWQQSLCGKFHISQLLAPRTTNSRSWFACNRSHWTNIDSWARMI